MKINSQNTTTELNDNQSKINNTNNKSVTDESSLNTNDNRNQDYILMDCENLNKSFDDENIIEPKESKININNRDNIDNNNYTTRIESIKLNNKVQNDSRKEKVSPFKKIKNNLICNKPNEKLVDSKDESVVEIFEKKKEVI